MASLLVVVTLYLFQGRKGPAQKTVAQDKESEEGIRLKDIHYVQDHPGHEVKWVLDASEAKLSKDQQFVTFLLSCNPRTCKQTARHLEGQTGGV